MPLPFGVDKKGKAANIHVNSDKLCLTFALPLPLPFGVEVLLLYFFFPNFKLFYLKFYYNDTWFNLKFRKAFPYVPLVPHVVVFFSFQL